MKRIKWKRFERGLALLLILFLAAGPGSLAYGGSENLLLTADGEGFAGTGRQQGSVIGAQPVESEWGELGPDGEPGFDGGSAPETGQPGGGSATGNGPEAGNGEGSVPEYGNPEQEGDRGKDGTDPEPADPYTKPVPEIENGGETEILATPMLLDMMNADFVNLAVFEGEGSKAEPYLIGTAEELKLFADLVNSGEPFEGQYFKLTADITLTDAQYADPQKGWQPIGDYDADENIYYYFAGHLDGGGYVIKDLFINRNAEARFQGLFGYIYRGTVENLGVVDCDITAGEYVGGLAGYVEEETVIRNCYVSGDVATTTVKGDDSIGSTFYTGGILGYAYESTISSCWSKGTVTGDGFYSHAIGGIAGTLNGSTLKECYSSCDILDTGTAAGGIAGQVLYGAAVEDCYSTGKVESDAGKAGGIAGYMDSAALQRCWTASIVIAGSGSPDSVGGIVGTVSRGSIVKDCLALNEYLEGPDGTGYAGETNRVVGASDENSGANVIENCLAWDKLPVNAAVALTDSLLNGEGKPVKDLIQSKSWPMLESNAWDYERPGTVAVLPGAGGAQDRALPPYLFEAVPEQNEDGYYEIFTEGHLEWVAENVNNGIHDETDRYKLMLDLDLRNDVSAEDWLPIGRRMAGFRGLFDGGGLSVTLPKTVTGVTGEWGLFGYTEDTSLLTNFMVIADTEITGETLFAGPLAGAAEGTVVNCHSRGKLQAKADESSYVGGLIGAAFGEVENCSAAVEVISSGTDSLWENITGGLIGALFDSAVVRDSYALGNISVLDGLFASAGGLIGAAAEAPEGFVENCFAMGSVMLAGSHEEDDFSEDTIGCAGGFIGLNQGYWIESCFSAGDIYAEGMTDLMAGGFVGWNSGAGAVIERCYAVSDVEAKGFVNNWAGAFCGYNGMESVLELEPEDEDAEILACYGAGDAVASGGSDLNAAGGFAGGNGDAAVIKDAYFDSDKVAGNSGIGDINPESAATGSTAVEATALKRSGMTGTTAVTSMNNLDFDAVWLAKENISTMHYYPQLRVFAEHGEDLVKEQSLISVSIEVTPPKRRSSSSGAASEGTSLLVVRGVDEKGNVIHEESSRKTIGSIVEVTAPEIEGYTLDDENRKTITIKAETNTVEFRYKTDGLLTHKAYMSGYPDGTFRPDRPMTRAEAASLFYALMEDAEGTAASSFSDVKQGSWYYDAVGQLSYKGVISGYPDGEFKPEGTITRAEFASMAARFGNVRTGSANSRFSDVSADHWAAEVIASAAEQGFVSGYGDGTFLPEKNITRAEVVSMINRLTGRDGSSQAAGNQTGFSDVAASHWAFADMLEAAQTHDYVIGGDGREAWH